MRTSLVLLAVLAACSDSSGPRQISVLTTQLSSAIVSDGSGVLGVSLRASNPTDTTLQLGRNGSLPGVGLGGVDVVNLLPGAVDTLGPTFVAFSPAAAQHNFTSQSFTLSPGTYSIRGCYYSYPATSRIVQPVCGNSVSFTLIP